MRERKLKVHGTPLSFAQFHVQGQCGTWLQCAQVISQYVFNDLVCSICSSLKCSVYVYMSLVSLYSVISASQSFTPCRTEQLSWCANGMWRHYKCMVYIQTSLLAFQKKVKQDLFKCQPTNKLRLTKLTSRSVQLIDAYARMAYPHIRNIFGFISKVESFVNYLCNNMLRTHTECSLLCFVQSGWTWLE